MALFKTHPRHTSDFYASQNIEWSGNYLLVSIHSSLYDKVPNRVPVISTGPEVLSTIIACSATFKTSNFPGEIESKMNAAIKVIL